MKGWLTLTVLRNLPVRLVLFTDQLQGGLCPSLILIVRSLTLIGRLPTLFSTLLSVFLLLVCRSFRFRGVQPGAVSVIESVKARVNFNLPLFFKRFAAVADGKLTFCL